MNWNLRKHLELSEVTDALDRYFICKNCDKHVTDHMPDRSCFFSPTSYAHRGVTHEIRRKANEGSLMRIKLFDEQARKGSHLGYDATARRLLSPL